MFSIALLIIVPISVVISEPARNDSSQVRDHIAVINSLYTRLDSIDERDEELKKLFYMLKEQNDQMNIEIEKLETDTEQLKNESEHLKTLIKTHNEQGATSNNYINSSSCLELYNSGHNASGIYQLNVFSKQISVYCEREGWMLIQKRFDGSVDFYKDWEQYKHGFGSLDGEFYLGNENIYHLTKGKPHDIRFDLHDWEGNNAYAKYSKFQISSEADNYRVTLDKSSYRGTAGNSFGSYHINQRFTTYDRDNDQDSSRNCAEYFHGAWWFNGCFLSHLNGEYFNSSQTPEAARGVIWHHWKGSSYSLEAVSMKIKPMN